MWRKHDQFIRRFKKSLNDAFESGSIKNTYSYKILEQAKDFQKNFKENNMKTCKDCIHCNVNRDTERVCIDNWLLHCGFDGLCVKYSQLEPKTNNMKRSKKEIKFIKQAYKDACEDYKEQIKENFPDIEFCRELPKTWEEYCRKVGMSTHLECRNLRSVSDEVRETGFIFWGRASDYISIPSKYIALRKLELLRNHYNDGWVKNKDAAGVNSIYRLMDDNIYKGYSTVSQFLEFETEDLAIEFLNNFKDLIEQAKDLI